MRDARVVITQLNFQKLYCHSRAHCIPFIYFTAADQCGDARENRVIEGLIIKRMPEILINNGG